MKKMINKKDAEEIISKSISALGLSENMKTNPMVMKEIIKEMRLDDFSSKSQILNLNEYITKEQSLKPIFLDIKKALLEKHPAIIEFLSLALENNWFKKNEKIIKSVHMILLLEYLTASMCNNDLYFKEVHEHIKNKENDLGINYSHPIRAFFNIFKLSHTFFGSTKALTVDPMLIHLNPKYRNFQLTKSELIKELKNKKLNYLEYRLLLNPNKLKSFNELGMLNIYEAGITDFNNDLKNNSLCAEALSEELKKVENINYKEIFIAPENTSNNFYKKLKNNYSISYPVSRKWQSLYVTWNLAFVLGNLDNLDILFAKLLLPSVLDAKSDQFVEARCVSLWLAINYYLFRLKDGTTIKSPENHLEIAQKWGGINKNYAIELARKDLHENEREFKQKYSRFFSHKYRNFFKILNNFF